MRTWKQVCTAITSILLFHAPLLLGGQLQTPQSAVERAVQVMGGKQVLEQIVTMQGRERRTTFHLTDSDHPEQPFLVDYAEVGFYADFEHERMVSQSDAQIANGDHQTTTVIYRASAAEMRSTYNGTSYPTRLIPAPQNWHLEDPRTVLLAALTASDLTNAGKSKLYGTPHTLVRFIHDGQPVTLELNDYNGYLDSITFRRCAPYSIALSVWGDYQEKVQFGDWRLQARGLHYPFLVTRYFNDVMERIDSTDQLELNPRESSLQSVANSPADPHAVESPSNVDDIQLSGLKGKENGNPGIPPKEIAPGVLQIPGNWYTAVIRQSDGLVVIDAPISSGYSKQVIEEAKRQYPGLPIKAVITSTSYWWHFAGLREYACLGIPIYVLDVNKPLIQAVLKAPHISHPDDLARSGAIPKLVAVSMPTTIGEGTNKLVLYPIRSSTGQMMMTWLPDAHILDTAEMAQPLGPNNTFLYPQSLWELMESAKRYQLPVEKIIGMHMSPTDWALLLKTVDEAIAGQPAPTLHN
jgi:hypothetical protein